MNKTLLIALTGMLAVATGTVSMANAGEHGTERGMGALSGDDRVHLRPAGDTRQHDEHADRHEASGDRDQRKRMHLDKGADRGMQAVPTTAGPGQPGHGWRFFSHPAADRAVVIGPLGDYYFSQGDGLRRVASAPPRS